MCVCVCQHARLCLRVGLCVCMRVCVCAGLPTCPPPCALACTSAHSLFACALCACGYASALCVWVEYACGYAYAFCVCLSVCLRERARVPVCWCVCLVVVYMVWRLFVYVSVALWPCSYVCSVSVVCVCGACTCLSVVCMRVPVCVCAPSAFLCTELAVRCRYVRAPPLCVVCLSAFPVVASALSVM